MVLERERTNVGWPSVASAKSLYDALIECHLASRQDRKKVGTAIIDVMNHRLYGGPRTSAWKRTYVDEGRITCGNAALLRHLLRNGTRIHVHDDRLEFKTRKSTPAANVEELLSQATSLHVLSVIPPDFASGLGR